jgi:hypothetical protein
LAATQRPPWERRPANARSNVNASEASRESRSEIVTGGFARLPFVTLRCTRWATTSRLIDGDGARVVNLTGEPLPWPATLDARSVTVYTVAEVRPINLADTGTGVAPAPSCWAHGTGEPLGGAGEMLNWQAVICELSGLTVPVTIAPDAVTPFAAEVITAGAGSVHVSVTRGSAPVAVGTSEKPVMPGAPEGTPEPPPPPPPPPEP